MTNETEKPVDDTPASGESVGDQKVVPDAPSSIDETHRRLAVQAGALLMMFAAPLFLNVEPDRSLWRMTRHEIEARIVLVTIFAWPVCLGLVCLVRGLRKTVPGKVLAVVSTVFASLYSIGGVLLMGGILASGSRERKSVFVWLGVVAVVMSLGAIVRSLFRSGWQRINHLAASVALLACMIVLSLKGAEPRALARPELGVWIFLFATAAFVPFIGVTMTARKT